MTITKPNGTRVEINTDLIRMAAERYASPLPTPKVKTIERVHERDPRTLKARVMVVAGTVKSFGVADIVGTCGCTKEQAWAAIARLSSEGEIEVVQKGGRRVPWTGKGGQTATYRKADVEVTYRHLRPRGPEPEPHWLTERIMKMAGTVKSFDVSDVVALGTRREMAWRAIYKLQGQGRLVVAEAAEDGKLRRYMRAA